MDIGRLGVWYAADKLDGPGWRTFVGAAERLGYGALWYSEARGFESLSLASFLLCHSERIHIGSSIANIYARDPAASRAGLHTLNTLSGGRFVLGLGVSHRPMVEGFHGQDYRRPLSTMRAYLEQMGAGEADAAQWPLAIAALGPRMLALSAELTRGALPYNVTPEHTARARDILGPDRRLVVEQKVSLEADPAVARAAARAELERYLRLDNYRRCWLSLGFDAGDIDGAGSDRFIDAMVAWGGQAAAEARIAEHFDAGADHVCIQPVHAPGDTEAALTTLEALAPGAT